MQIAWNWPSGFQASAADIFAVLLQGARFDLKVSASAAMMFLPLLIILPNRFHGWVGGFIAVLFIFASLINLHYFGFYKTPIDSIVFGFFEDDTKAIIQTIWANFPVVLTLGILLAVSLAAIKARKILYDHISMRLKLRSFSVWVTLLAVVLGLFMLVLTIKGTLRAMALGKQNVSVTTSQFLNDMVPNGVTAFKFALDDRQDSQNFKDALLGLKHLGYNSPLEAARALGIKAANENELHNALLASGTGKTGEHKKNLVFIQMESWSAEPLLYQASDFDMLGRLGPTLSHACHFSNFDSAQPGTHPTLEAILFSTPITPLTLGPQGKSPIPWAIPLVFKRAGYHTVFVTSALAGWRDLDRVLKVQGFDEVIDANNLRTLYPDATIGIWGVWDGYLFDYIKKRLKETQPDDKPLFIFGLTTTNHPPFDLPADYAPPPFNMDRWGGERASDDLVPSLKTYRYSSDVLGGLVQEVLSSPLRATTVIAATGDHNAHTLGSYSSPERHYLAGQVPFIFWDDGVDCGNQLKLPASHRDMFPTLFPLVGVHSGYLRTGRNLLTNPAREPNPALNAPLVLRYFGMARNAQGVWDLGKPASFDCTPSGPKPAQSCKFDPQADAEARAWLGLLDWDVRSTLR